MKPTVLMLGWEYPPIINGGLGIASMGLSQALSKSIPVHLIVPNSHPEHQEENTHIIGLDKIELEELWDDTNPLYAERLQDLRLSYVNIPLSGYEIPKEEVLQEEILVEDPPKRLPRRFFELKELYGSDLPRRIIDYSEISIRLATDLDFDVIHAHDWMTFAAAIEIKKECGKPLVLHVHSLEYDRGGAENKNWVFELEKKAFEEADLIIPVSYYTAEIIRKYYGIDPQKIKPVHNAAITVESYRKEKPFKEKLVSFIGRLTHQKGPEYFFEMAMEILSRMDGVRFLIAGQGQALDTMLDKVSTAQIGDKFHFAGFLSRAKTMDLLAMTDVCVMPSESEPFGLVALEATQMGVPCVIPYQSGVSELLLQTPKFQAGNVAEMADCTISLLQDKEYHKKTVLQNKKDIDGISWEDAARRILDYYQTILK